MPDNDATRKLQKELNAGITALVALTLVERAGRPAYGYELAQLLSSLADDAPPMTAGALYPVLRSLERSKLLTSKVEPSVSGPPRRYYSITATGRSVLAEWKAAWFRTRSLVDRILESKHEHRATNAARRTPLSRRARD
jgi:PadR family transcriptional regulator PadR